MFAQLRVQQVHARILAGSAEGVQRALVYRRHRGVSIAGLQLPEASTHVLQALVRSLGKGNQLRVPRSIGMKAATMVMSKRCKS